MADVRRHVSRSSKTAAFLLALGVALAWAPARTDNDLYFLSAPPWTTWDAGTSMFNPIAFHLSQASGKQVIYRHYDTWPLYMRDMRDAEFDIVFSDAHLVSWRMREFGDTPIARLNAVQGYAIVTQEDNERIVQLTDLAGQLVCGDVPPSLAALILYAQFSNPIRQPHIVIAPEDVDAVNKLLKRQCQGAVLSLRGYKNLNPDQKANTRLLFISDDIPSRAFTVGARIPNDVREIFRSALLSSQGRQASRKLLRHFGANLELVSTSGSEYRGLWRLLQHYPAMD